MTVRTIGQILRTAGPSRAVLAAVLATAIPVAAAAQQTESPAPTPAPSSTFRLPPTNDGRAPGVQGPADNGLPPLAPGERAGQPTPAPTPAPQPTPPAVASTRPATPTPSAPVRRDAAAASASAPRAAQASGAVATPAAPTTVAAPSATDAGTADTGTPPAAPGFTTDPTVPAPAPPPADVASPATPLGGESAPPLWAWLLAGVAAAGAGLWYWRRRSATAGDAPAADFEPVPAAPTRQPPPTQRAAAPAPALRAPAAPTSAPSPLVTRPADERRAIIGMALDVRGIRLTPDQLIVAFSLNLLNQGPVTATGLMVRIALNQGTAMTEPVLARFFDGAGGSVLRDDMILAPGAGEQLSTEVMLPRATIEPLMVGGKPVLVPVMAFDVTYHWDGEGEAFGQNAGTFVLGREQGGSTSEKLSPLPLDHPNLVVNRPAARTTALKRSQ